MDNMVVYQAIMKRMRAVVGMFMLMLFAVISVYYRKRGPRLPPRPFSVYEFSKRMYIRRLLDGNDTTYKEQLRMDRHCFFKLCEMLRDIGGLKSTRHIDIDEQVAITLYILAHHKKNQIIKFDFGRSGETVSRYFNKVLLGILRLHNHLTKRPEPIATGSNDERWNCFENCLGALDGTHVNLRVPLTERPRYRNRKGDITTNVLAACAPDLQIIYVQPGWEGSASDSRILRDAIARENGLRVPQGCYFLVDAGYANYEGFLAPYRGVRYHLNEWSVGHQPTNVKEYFNMKHARARNVIERCFGLLKLRWAILRSASYYPVKVHNRIVHACCLLQNFIRMEMSVDPLEAQVPEDYESEYDMDMNFVTEVRASTAWSMWRDELADDMFNSWIAS